MARVLVYYVSVGGEAYYKQTLAAIRSLRQFGKYDGDIAVITDQIVLFQNVITIPLSQVMPPRKEGDTTKTYFQCIKPMILNANPYLVGQYDLVLYIDSDTLVVSPRFGMLISAMATVGGLWVQQNYWTCVGNGKQVNMGAELDPAIFRLCQNVSACSGIVGFGFDAIRYIDRWRKLVEQNGFSYDDQALLQIVCAECNDGRVHYIPEQDVWFPTNRVLSPSIYHFTHQGKREQEEMTKLLFPAAFQSTT